MKEYYSTTGGRHLYNSDFNNLQEIALASFEIFSDCGQNFVISGCGISENVVGSGYAFIGGKVRDVPQTTVGQVNDTLFIRARQVNGPDIKYADGTTHPQYIDYTSDVINTNAISGSHIEYDTELGRFPNISDVFFNHYSLVKGATEQVVDANTVFSKLLTTHGLANLSSDGYKRSHNYVDANGNLCLTIWNGETEKITYKLSQDGIFGAYNGTTLLWQIGSADGWVTLPSIQVPQIRASQAIISDGPIQTSRELNANSVTAGSVSATGNVRGQSLSSDTSVTASNVSCSGDVTGREGRFNEVSIDTSNANGAIAANLVGAQGTTALKLSAPNNGIALALLSGYITGLRFGIKLVNGDTYSIGSHENDSNYIMFISTYSDASTIYLPESPSDGMVLIVGKGMISSFNLTVQATGGAKIRGGVIYDNYIVLPSGHSAILVYSQTLSSWIRLTIN